MASYTVAAGKIGKYAKTLTAGTADTVTFTDDVRAIEVSSDGAAALYVRVDGTAPTAGDDATIEMPAGVRSVRTITVQSDGGTVVKLISAGTPTYSVARVVG